MTSAERNQIVWYGASGDLRGGIANADPEFNRPQLPMNDQDLALSPVNRENVRLIHIKRLRHPNIGGFVHLRLIEMLRQNREHWHQPSWNRGLLNVFLPNNISMHTPNSHLSV
jgi:hypothetical protein